MTYLVTGCNGFVGTWLCKALKETGNRVIGFDMQPEPRSILDEYAQIDITDQHAVLSFCGKYDLNGIYHLAALASPRACALDPVKALSINVQGAVNLYEICRLRPEVRLVVIGSSEEYLKIASKKEYFETDTIDTNSIYGVSKKAAEEIGLAYVQNYNADILFTRSFNHTGPGQLPEYVLSDFARQVALISLGKQEPQISTGNIDISRDFLDVRDVVAAYISIMSNGKKGEVYNVASGTSYKIRKLLDMLIAMSEENNISVAIDDSKYRKNEILEFYGNFSKLNNHTNWKPEIPIEKTLSDVYTYWKTKPIT